MSLAIVGYTSIAYIFTVDCLVYCVCSRVNTQVFKLESFILVPPPPSFHRDTFINTKLQIAQHTDTHTHTYIQIH